ncbi:MAG: hypothetical protein QNJ13_07590 [Paracoccaceae bacterium]|nr:hypothetical protein [Paracoccaceae bacterium]
MTRWLPLLAGLALAGCVETQNTLAREAARSAVRPVLAERFPGVPLEPATDCVIDNATAGEILSLAADAATGRPDAGTVETTLTILSRPETITCLATEGLPVLLTRG